MSFKHLPVLFGLDLNWWKIILMLVEYIDYRRIYVDKDTQGGGRAS